MGNALITDAGAALNPGANFTAIAAGQGSSLTVRNFGPTDTAQLVELTRRGATAGAVRVRSTKLVDDVQGIRYACASGTESFLLNRDVLQGLYAQDTLTIEVTGGGAESDGAAISTYYSNIAGVSQRLHMPADIAQVTKYVTTWEVNAAAPATIGDWKSTVITSLYDQSQANSDYAVLGYVVDAPVLAVAISGTETGNQFIGGPGDTVAEHTRSYFADLSLRLGKPCIPVINAANKGNINVGVVDVAANTAVNVTLVLALLSQTTTP